MSREHRDHTVSGSRTFRSKGALASTALALGIALSVHATSAEELSQDQRGTKIGLPAIESLDLDSDYTGFLASNVPTEIRQLALRKLWSSPMFNQTDRLDTYTGDYSRVGDQQRHGKFALNPDRN